MRSFVVSNAPEVKLQTVMFMFTQANSLRVGLLQQGAPELVPLFRVDKQQLPILHRQPVIDDDVHPLAELPELKSERAEGLFFKESVEILVHQSPTHYKAFFPGFIFLI